MATKLTESLFPDFAGLLATPAEALRAQPIQAAYADRGDTLGFIRGQIRGAGAEMRQGIGRAFGQEPAAVAQQQKLAAVVQQVQQTGVDLATAEGQVALAQELSKYPEFIGMATAMRQQAATAAQESQLKAAQTQKALAEAQKATREKEMPPLDQARQAVLLLAGKTDLSPQENQILNNARELLKLSVPGGTTVNLTQESKFAGERGQLQAKALDSAALSASSARASLNTLQDMERLSTTNELYSGPLAMTALGAANFLNSVGLLSPAQSRNLASAERYDKGAKDLVMQELGGKLGAQISNTDRDFIEARIPQLKNSPQARVEIIQKLKEIQQGKISLYQKMNAHANQFNNLNAFDFSQNYMPTNIIGPAPEASGTGTRENPIKLK
jgi:hypothetical protein